MLTLIPVFKIEKQKVKRKKHWVQKRKSFSHFFKDDALILYFLVLPRLMAICFIFQRSNVISGNSSCWSAFNSWSHNYFSFQAEGSVYKKGEDYITFWSYTWSTILRWSTTDQPLVQLSYLLKNDQLTKQASTIIVNTLLV